MMIMGQNKNHIIKCIFCNHKFNGFDESVFVDDLVNDCGSSELECPWCKKELVIETTCEYTFKVDEDFIADVEEDLTED